jgi:hypothetical protein
MRPGDEPSGAAIATKGVDHDNEAYQRARIIIRFDVDVENLFAPPRQNGSRTHRTQHERPGDRVVTCLENRLQRVQLIKFRAFANQAGKTNIRA